MNNRSVKIKVIPNGPYEVENLEKLQQYLIKPDAEGASEEYVAGENFEVKENPIHLCRCGHSKHAPFCDGSHEAVNWDGSETASFAPILEGAEAIEGPNLTLMDNQNYCAYARFCDAKGRVWNLVQMGEAETDKQAIKEAQLCPAGRLMMYDNKTSRPLEPKLDKEIGVLEDPVMRCSGPLYVKGGIEVESAEGRSYEKRNRQTLCRCGHSHNKPFCDGSHASISYQDGI